MADADASVLADVGNAASKPDIQEPPEDVSKSESPANHHQKDEL